MRIVAGLPGDQARDILAFLQASNNPEPRSQSAAQAAPGGSLSGDGLIAQYGCAGCHVIDGQGGRVGPSLDDVFERRDAEWIRVQLRDPRSHKRATAMPDFGLSDAEVEAIVRALREGQ